MKKSKKMARMVLVILFAVGLLSLTGCEKTDDDSEQTETDTTKQYEISIELTASDTEKEQSTETDSIIRAYSDTEIDRMIELRQSYLDGSASPEKQMLEVENAESVVSGTLCYVKNIGRYCLPDRELTDEELLEIIDYDYTKKVALNGKTQEQMEAEDIANDLAERVMLEEKVKAAGGISEEEAIEIAKKAMEADIGEKAKELKVYIDPEAGSYGWKLGLWDITDWDEYKDKGDIAYSVNFDNVEKMEKPEDFFAYSCFVNAVDGSICGAYSISGDDRYLNEDDIVWYEH